METGLAHDPIIHKINSIYSHTILIHDSSSMVKFQFSLAFQFLENSSIYHQNLVIKLPRFLKSVTKILKFSSKHFSFKIYPQHWCNWFLEIKIFVPCPSNQQCDSDVGDLKLLTICGCCVDKKLQNFNDDWIISIRLVEVYD